MPTNILLIRHSASMQKRRVLAIYVETGQYYLVSAGNGKVIELDVPAQIMNGRTLVPLRFVSETLDAKVEWDANTKTVFITTGVGTGITTPGTGPGVTPGPGTGDVNKGAYTETEIKAVQEQFAKSIKFETDGVRGAAPVLREGYEWGVGISFVRASNGTLDFVSFGVEFVPGEEFFIPVDWSKYTGEGSFRFNANDSYGQSPFNTVLDYKTKKITHYDK